MNFSNTERCPTTSISLNNPRTRIAEDWSSGSVFDFITVIEHKETLVAVVSGGGERIPIIDMFKGNAACSHHNCATGTSEIHKSISNGTSNL